MERFRGYEAGIEELLGDDIIALMLASDKLSRDQLDDTIRTARVRLRQRQRVPADNSRKLG